MRTELGMRGEWAVVTRVLLEKPPLGPLQPSHDRSGGGCIKAEEGGKWAG